MIIECVGAPPERHADRVIAKMLRDLARKRAHLQDAVADEFRRPATRARSRRWRRGCWQPAPPR
jgi:hypothetical protein